MKKRGDVYYIATAADLPDVLSPRVLYHCGYDAGSGSGLYYSDDEATLTAIGGGAASVIGTFYDSTVNQVIATTELTVNIDATSLNIGSGLSLASDVITVTNAGNYKLSYHIKARLTTGTRDCIEAVLHRDPLGGGSYAVIAGTETGLYGRIANEPTSGALPPFALALTAGDLIRLRAIATGGDLTTEAASITIEKIP